MVFPTRKNASSNVQQSSSSSSSPESTSKRKFSLGRKHTKKCVVEDKNDDVIDDQATIISYVHEPYVKVQEIDRPAQPAHNTEEKEVLHNSEVATVSATTAGRDDCCSTLDTFYEMFFGEGEGIDNIIECTTPPCGINDDIDIIECGCSPTSTSSSNNDSFGTAATSCSPWSSNSSWNPNFFQEEDASPEPEGTDSNAQPMIRLRCH